MRLCAVPFLIAAFAIPGAGFADIAYTVTPKAEQGLLAVRMDIPVLGVETTLQLPSWAPGSYVLSNSASNIQDFKAVDGAGQSIGFVQVNPSTWRIPGMNGGRVTVTYSVKNAPSDSVLQYSGPATYMYVVGRKTEPCALRLEPPADWKVAVGLDGGKNVYRAKNYDVLADNPVTMGLFNEDTYKVRGRVHTIALRGAARKQIDRAKLLKACRTVSEIETDFFGGAPYNKYVWHFTVFPAADGAGGLEHLSSTQIRLSSGLGPGAVGVLAHEFFHAWNVKRIRSKPLGPFDYTQLPQTGALWWLEGVTDYYAHSLLRRYGWSDDKEFYTDVLRNVTRQRARPARLEVGPYEASMRVREANNGRGNSDGYRVSYYDTGYLVGLCLDIEILSQTEGTRSLDDVEQALWRLCRNDQPGFEEGEIRRQLVRFGGEPLGTMYDTIVMKGGELPIEAQLAKVGLQMTEREEPAVSLGFETRRAPSGDLRVTSSDADSPIKVDDLLTSVGSIVVSGQGVDAQEAFRKAIAETKPGTPVEVKVRRGTETVTVQVTPKTITRKVREIVALSGAAPESQRLKTIWLAKRR